MRIITVFDYAFYRVAKLYFRWDQKQAVTAIVIISLSESMFIIDIIGYLFVEFFNEEQRLELSEYFALICLGILTLIFLYNRKRYTEKLGDFEKKWHSEKGFSKFFGGLFVFFLIIIPIALPAVILNLKN